MTDYVVARTDEIEPGQCKIVKIRNVSIGLYRIDDEYYALPNICPHQLGPLCEGAVSGAVYADQGSEWQSERRFEGQVVACPWHGLEFHIVTGQCLAFSRMRLRHYPVTVDGADIKITLRS